MTSRRLKFGVPAPVTIVSPPLPIPLAAAEKALELPAAQWAGNCYGVATRFVEKGLVPGGRAVYGSWRGAVAPGTLFDTEARRMLRCARHGWVRVGAYVVDPTRWVFEGAEPYVYIGELSDDYDEGANTLREQLMRPPPPYTPGQSSYGGNYENPEVKLRMKKTARAHVYGLLGDTRGFTRERVFWVANLPLHFLAPHAPDIYRALCRGGYEAAIPIDNRRSVLGGG